ncbi:MAG: cyclodeaminase/cyclohydrolase family protein, partial [Phycisphaerae bacterium]
ASTVPVRRPRAVRRLIDADMAAFRRLMACWRLPDDDPARREKNQAATIGATRTPIEIMSAAYAVMQLASTGIDKSKKNCLSDAGVAAFLAHACLEGARMNVMINLPGIEDAREREALKTRADRLRSDAAALAEDITRRLEALYH